MNDQTDDQFRQHVLAAFDLYYGKGYNSYEIKQYFLGEGYDESYCDKVVEAMLQMKDPTSKRDHSYLINGIILKALGVGVSKLLPGFFFVGLMAVGIVSIIKWIFNSRWE